jgi:SAM-dependent methyltransferase
MYKKDIDIVRALHQKYQFKGPLVDAGGLEFPAIADYDISVASAIEMMTPDGRFVKIPNSYQEDRYLKIARPWSFIDPNYLIVNPAKGDPFIEGLPDKYPDHFETVILVSVFEHVENPYKISDALYKIVKPGGYLFNSTPFLFPYHPSPEDNFRYSPRALKRIHEYSGFKWLEGDFHINYSSKEGIGDTNPNNYGAPQAIMVSYALCRKN